MNQPRVTVENGHAYTTTLEIARTFEREHWSVIQTIEKMMPHLPEGFIRQNFLTYDTTNSQGKNIKAYRLTFSGFAMIALGFTGEKAIKFRVAYINRFDEMERQLKEKELARVEREYVEEKYLPFGQPVIRATVPLSDAVKHLHILGLFPELTTNRLKSMIRRGEADGTFDARGFARIYVDEVTRLATKA